MGTTFCLPDKPTLTKKETAFLCSMSEDTVNNFISAGIFKTKQRGFGRKRTHEVVVTASVARWLNEEEA